MADTTTTTQQSWLQPRWDQYLTGLQGLLGNNAPFPTYNGPTVAPFNQNQNTAADLSYQFATNGTPYSNAAANAVATQANGVANPYMGDNPYLQSVIDKSNADIAKAYANGTAAQTAGAAAQQGAYGGSAYQEQVGMNNQTLANQLAANTNSLRYNNYLNSGNLFNQDQARQLQAASLSPSLQNADLNSFGNLFGMGNQQQQNTQQNLDAMQQQFANQQQANFLPYDIFGNALSRAQGASVSSTSSLPGYNWPLNLAGLGLSTLPFIFGNGG